MSEVQGSAPLKSYELVSNELVTDALKNDKGPNAELLSWEIKPFTNKGDNYSSIVVGITVSYRKNEMDSECTYVAKLNPLRPLNSNTENFEKSYTRETEVLNGIVEGMNNELKRLGFDAIKTPKLLSKNLEKGREAFVTENLRTQGFKMSDKMRGMDLNHSLFVVKELGRFHASSLLFEETLPTKYIPDTFNGVKELKKELHDQKIFGMASSMMVLQFSLAQGEDVPDMEDMTDDRMDEFFDKQTRKFEEMSGREGPFRDRYIAIFDDMLDTDIFDAD
ncbi:hypothetical protein Avbf_01638 [Armadillidium vulgare]|nr:hypothetical protein Avbf_01638 [Armadillidium vulgare]